MAPSGVGGVNSAVFQGVTPLAGYTRPPLRGQNECRPTVTSMRAMPVAVFKTATRGWLSAP